MQLLNPIVNQRGIPREYSHMMFFAIGTGGIPPIPEGSTALAMVAMGVLGAGVLWRRSTRA